MAQAQKVRNPAFGRWASRTDGILSSNWRQPMFSRGNQWLIALMTLLVVAGPAFAQGVQVQDYMPAYEAYSTGPELRLDSRIESPPRNNNARELPERQPGDTIQIQLFAPDAGGRQIQGYTVEFALRGKTIADYVTGASGQAWTGSDLLYRVSGDRVSLSMLSLDAVTIPANGYLGRIELSARRALTSSDVLDVKSAQIGGAGVLEDLDVSGASIFFTAAPQCPGDFDDNGMVNLADFLALAGAFGAVSGDGNFDARVDMDGSGGIDLTDFLAFAAVFGTACEVPAGGGIVAIPDPNLRAVIANSLGKPRDAPVIRAEMATLTRLEARNAGIGNLTGLEHATGLRALILGRARVEGVWTNSNAVSDLSPLYALTSLEVLDVSGNRLSGEIPRELAGLPNLVSLYLHTNEFSGEIPTELAGLSNLEVLTLSRNQLSGELPPELSEMSNLTWINLFGNQLSGEIPAELGRLANLEALILFSNRLSGEIPPELGGLTRLAWLDLNVNQLSGPIPSELGSLSNLVGLNLSDNQLSGSLPVELGKLTSLEALGLAMNRLSGPTPPELGNLTKLVGLFLNDNVSLTGALPQSLTRLTLLKTFRFQNTGLCAPLDASFQDWLRGIEDIDGENCSRSSPPSGGNYRPLSGLRVSAGRVQFLFFSAGRCIQLSNTTINGVTYTAHTSKWQRKQGTDWVDVSGTQRTGLCSYSPTRAGEYRLVAEITINGVRGRYASENTLTVSG